MISTVKTCRGCVGCEVIQNGSISASQRSQRSGGCCSTSASTLLFCCKTEASFSGKMSTDEKIADSPSGDNSPPPETSSDIEHEQINEKALLRKLDAQLLPAVGILYLLSFLDRSNGRIGSSYTLRQGRY